MGQRQPNNAPSWRSSLPIERKSSQTPSISVVFAEGEQRSPQTGSAARRLSSRMARSIKRERDIDTPTAGSSSASINAELEDKPSDPLSSTVHDIDDSNKRMRLEQPEASGSLAGGTAQNQERMEMNSSRRGSWFPFGSRRKSTNDIVARQTVLDPQTFVNEPGHRDADTEHPSAMRDQTEALSPIQNAPIASNSSDGANVAEDATMEDPPSTDAIVDKSIGAPNAPLSSSQQRSSLWFTQQAPLPSRPPFQQIPSAAISIDDESRTSTPIQSIPHSKSPPPAILTSNQLPGVQISSLNSSRSRFALNAPLLGRPKVPLDQIMQRTDLDLTDKTVEAQMTGEEANVPDVPQMTVNNAPETHTGTHDASSIHSAPPIKESSSWWNYVGLGSGKSAQSLPLPSDDAVQPETPEVISEFGERREEPFSPPAEAVEPLSSAPMEATPSDTSEKDPANNIETDAPRDIGASSMAWYSPWGWTSVWQNKPVDAQIDAESNTMTESELVKEEALARPDPEQLQASPLADITTPENPIASSAVTHSAGWSSFFYASRFLAIKSVTADGERDENGMEVMDIDINEENATKPSPTMLQQSCTTAVGTTVPENGTDCAKTATEDAAAKQVNPPPSPALRKAAAGGRASPTPSNKSKKSSVPPSQPRPPNLVLPSFDDTFLSLPRSQPRPSSPSGSTLSSTITGFVSSMIYGSVKGKESSGRTKGKGKEGTTGQVPDDFGKDLPRAWNVVADDVPDNFVLKSCENVVVIGIHGWFPGLAMRTMLGEPTGTSTKFATMMGSAVDNFAEKHGHTFKRVTRIPLEGEGKISHRVEKLYINLTGNDEWLSAVREADVIFVATHSQGSIVATHLISRLIVDGHIRTSSSASFSSAAVDAATAITSLASGGGLPSAALVQTSKVQRVCCLALCGIHLGPFAYLQKSSLVMPYIQYFESEAAAELFEFQNTESKVSKEYMNAAQHVIGHGVKFVYIASLNDQVVPVYSGAFASASHPLILRALYIDGDAYHSSDFLSNLLVLLFRIRNAKLSDGGLLAHLSEATAGSLSGVGHSTAYEEPATFSLAVEYLFMTDEGSGGSREIEFEPFNARSALNDYEIPWALRELIADERVVRFFSEEFEELRDQFDHWMPRTTILRDLKRKLEPIRRLKLSSRL